MNSTPSSRKRHHVPTEQLLIAGEFVETHATEWRDIVNPATQELLARVPFSTEAEVGAADEAPHAAFDKWKSTPISARMR
ncbi:aldehyde dehydrogenase family protein, partial [Burkholderia pseudomallei]